jgi:outer membrane protein assembly factor BamA
VIALLFTSRLAFPQESEQEKSTSSPQSAEQDDERSSVRLGGGGFHSSRAPTPLDMEKTAAQSSAPKPTKRFDFAGTPIPVINPTIGNGLGGVGMVAFHIDPKDTQSRPSVFGGGVMFTDNGSWGFGVGTNLVLKKDRFRVLGVIGDGRLNYDFYGVGNDNGGNGLFIPISQKALGFLVEPKVRIVGHWFIGPRYHLIHNDVTLDRNKLQGELPGTTTPGPESPDEPELPEQDLQLKTAALGLRVQRDSRDSQFYPHRGSFFDTQLDFFDAALGGDRKYQSYEVSFQGYNSIGSKNVIAYRGAVCSSAGDVPFYDLCLLGNSKDLRGYAIGQYRDRRMLVGQVEYRRELFWRLGAVAYFGAGEVADKFSDFDTESILPGGGIGLRFTLAKQDHINLRIDYAWGKNSTALYIGIMEAF